MKKIANVIREKGLIPSQQRVAIYQYLCSRKNHPNAEMVYSALLQQMPSLSMTTVYNVLHSFSEHGLVQTILVEEKEMRFDADVSFHAHFKCTKCGKIFDLPCQIKPQEGAVLPENFVVATSHLYYTGSCACCAQSK